MIPVVCGLSMCSLSSRHGTSSIESTAEANGIGETGRISRKTQHTAGEVAGVEPRAAAYHALLAAAGAARVLAFALLVVGGGEPVRYPFPNVATHFIGSDGAAAGREDAR